MVSSDCETILYDKWFVKELIEVDADDMQLFLLKTWSLSKCMPVVLKERGNKFYFLTTWSLLSALLPDDMKHASEIVQKFQ